MEKVKVEFPDGSTREIAPAYWVMEEDFFHPLKSVDSRKPVFEIEGYKVLATVDGRYVAAATTHLRS